MGVFSKEYIPQGTRFGPLQGVIYTKDNVPKQANRKYFWRVSETHIHTYIYTNIQFTCIPILICINTLTQLSVILVKQGKVSNLDVRK